jgi:predicted ATP-dependent endonuclease of OLD family
MKITKIEIKRFRSILDLKLDLNLNNNFSTICGANNSGKTNVLKALNIFFNPSEYIVAEDVPNHKYFGSRGGATYPEITLTFRKDNEEWKIKRFFGLDGLEKSEGNKTILSPKNTIKINDPEIEKVLNQIAFFFIPAINISFPKLINNLIDDVYDLEYEKTRFRGLKQDLKTTFDNYINGLVEILNHLAEEINPIFKNFNDNWSVGFENSADVKKFKDLISQDIEFFLNDKSNRNIQGKGSGLQRLGYILLHSRIIEKLKKKSVIFCVDEPDVFLHQGLQKKLKEHLKYIATTHQVIITTHSPIFIDSYKLDNVFLLDLEIENEVYYKRTDNSYYPLNTNLVDISQENGIQKIKEYLGISTEDYDLLENYNIIVEGDCDIKYLTETCNYFEISTPKIIASMGASKIEKYIDFYNSFYSGREIKPSILIIFDNDDAGREEYRKIHKKQLTNQYQNLHLKIEFIPNCYGEIQNIEDVRNNKVRCNYEIEDFIYPELLLNNCNILLKKINFKTLRFQDLERKIKAKAFKEKGVLYNLDLIKNDKNPEEGNKIDFSSEQAKKGLSGLYNLKGDKKISESINELDLKYPEVKKYLERIMDFKNFKK